MNQQFVEEILRDYDGAVADGDEEGRFVLVSDSARVFAHAVPKVIQNLLLHRNEAGNNDHPSSRTSNRARNRRQLDRWATTSISQSPNPKAVNWDGRSIRRERSDSFLVYPKRYGYGTTTIDKESLRFGRELGDMCLIQPVRKGNWNNLAQVDSEDSDGVDAVADVVGFGGNSKRASSNDKPKPKPKPRRCSQRESDANQKQSLLEIAARVASAAHLSLQRTDPQRENSQRNASWDVDPTTFCRKPNQTTTPSLTIPIHGSWKSVLDEASVSVNHALYGNAQENDSDDASIRTDDLDHETNERDPRLSTTQNCARASPRDSLLHRSGSVLDNARFHDSLTFSDNWEEGGDHGGTLALLMSKSKQRKNHPSRALIPSGPESGTNGSYTSQTGDRDHDSEGPTHNGSPSDPKDRLLIIGGGEGNTTTNINTEDTPRSAPPFATETVPNHICDGIDEMDADAKSRVAARAEPMENPFGRVVVRNSASVTLGSGTIATNSHQSSMPDRYGKPRQSKTKSKTTHRRQHDPEGQHRISTPLHHHRSRSVAAAEAVTQMRLEEDAASAIQRPDVLFPPCRWSSCSNSCTDTAFGTHHLPSRPRKERNSWPPNTILVDPSTKSQRTIRGISGVDDNTKKMNSTFVDSRFVHAALAISEKDCIRAVEPTTITSHHEQHPT